MMKFNFIKIRIHWLIIIFCGLAATRVFIYSGAFPFFTNMDEQYHFDLVMKYSQGHIPKSLENLSQQSVELIVTTSFRTYILFSH